jgi:hypothetical protein
MKEMPYFVGSPKLVITGDRRLQRFLPLVNSGCLETVLQVSGIHNLFVTWQCLLIQLVQTLHCSLEDVNGKLKSYKMVDNFLSVPILCWFSSPKSWHHMVISQKDI